MFANAVIVHGAENPAAFVDHCVLGQPCYGRFYLPKSLRESAHDNYAQAIALRATVDGRPMPEGVFQMISWWSTYNFTRFRASGDDEAWEHPRWFLRGSRVSSRPATTCSSSRWSRCRAEAAAVPMRYATGGGPYDSASQRLRFGAVQPTP